MLAVVAPVGPIAVLFVQRVMAARAAAKPKAEAQPAPPEEAQPAPAHHPRPRPPQPATVEA
jgi:hypothetical protein